MLGAMSGIGGFLRRFAAHLGWAGRSATSARRRRSPKFVERIVLDRAATGQSTVAPRLARVSRRKRSRQRRRRYALIAVSVLGVTGATVLLSSGWKTQQAFSDGRTTQSAAQILISPAKLVDRPLLRREYPYSVVAGGLYSRHEFNKAVVRDSVASTHYADIRSFQLRPTTIRAIRAAYVSYRVDDDIYWTKRPVQIAVGETLLTDGEHLLRARCGNRISEIPRFPVRQFEPPQIIAEELDPGPDPPMITAHFDIDVKIEVLGPPVPAPRLPSPPLPPAWPTEPVVTTLPFTHGPPIAVVPEPSSLILLGSVLLLIGGRFMRRRSEKR